MHKLNFAQKVVVEGETKSIDKVSPEQRMNRNRLQEDLNSQQIDTLSFEIFVKTVEEKKILKDLKRTAPKSKKYRTLSFEDFKDAWKNNNK